MLKCDAQMLYVFGGHNTQTDMQRTDRQKVSNSDWSIQIILLLLIIQKASRENEARPYAKFMFLNFELFN